MNEDFGVEISLGDDPQNFLKIMETLTRIGIASPKTHTLYQSCHILHKRDRFYIVHFKEMFELDGKPSNFDETDKQRRNAIANRVVEWFADVGVKLIDPSKSVMTEDEKKVIFRNIKVIKWNEKDAWTLKAKYTVGNKKKVVSYGE